MGSLQCATVVVSVFLGVVVGVVGDLFFGAIGRVMARLLAIETSFVFGAIGRVMALLLAIETGTNGTNSTGTESI